MILVQKNNEEQNITFEKKTTPDGWVHKHPHSVPEHCVSLLPFLVVHHQLTKVLLIGIIFKLNLTSSLVEFGYWNIVQL